MTLPETYEVTDDGCWRWTGYVDRNGYGRVYDINRPVGHRTEWAHRAYYRAHKGEIPAGHDIDHVCQNTLCVNPLHLDAVTRAEHISRTMTRLGKDRLHESAAILRRQGLTFAQIADALGFAGKESAKGAVEAAIAKGLIDPNDVPPARRITEQERADMRDLYAMGVPQTEIAAWYDIDSSQVSRICNGHTSGHATRGVA